MDKATRMMNSGCSKTTGDSY